MLVVPVRSAYEYLQLHGAVFPHNYLRYSSKENADKLSQWAVMLAIALNDKEWVYEGTYRQAVRKLEYPDVSCDLEQVYMVIQTHSSQIDWDEAES